MQNKKPINEPSIWGLCGKAKSYSHQGTTHPTTSCHSRDTSRTSPQHILHSDNYDFVIANEWTTLLDRTSLSNEELREWCNFVDDKYEYIPTLDELLYPDNFAERHYEL